MNFKRTALYPIVNLAFFLPGDFSILTLDYLSFSLSISLFFFTHGLILLLCPHACSSCTSPLLPELASFLFILFLLSVSGVWGMRGCFDLPAIFSTRLRSMYDLQRSPFRLPLGSDIADFKTTFLLHW